MSGFGWPKSCEKGQAGEENRAFREVWRSESGMGGELLRPPGVEREKWMGQGQLGRFESGL
jgi:hypothetical protein